MIIPKSKSWVGFDLDGTLARHTGGYDVTRKTGKIGDPIPPMVKLLLTYVDQGVTVKIFTARGSNPAEISNIHRWLLANGMPKLEVTDQKDYHLVHFYDDRAIAVQRDTGKILSRGDN